MAIKVIIHRSKRKSKDASFPSVVKYKGQTYVPTGKTGTNVKTGLASREYRLPDERVWVLADGSIEED